MPAEIVPFLALGFLGSLHCLAMCGGFAVAAGAGPRSRRGSLARLACFVAGKAATYAVLALLASRLGGLVAGGLDLERARGALALATGLLLCALGLSLSGVSLPVAWRPRMPRAAGGLSAAYRRLVAGARSLPGLAGALAAGLATGLLPCGLSWSAVLLAIPLPPATAALGGFAFGAGTAPVLIAAGAGFHAVPPAWRRVAARGLGPALCALGVLTIARGSPFLSWQPLQRALPECCRDAE